ncbi:hypothetical protein GCM10022252_03240 [Streptosporangium oxazolinicum]|uniref:Tyr recombinase domain-containing protein n=2 Tax=Streptosporangium oxazolinicum TaxID=909287 RepID=A0ABP8AA23_9ACTN
MNNQAGGPSGSTTAPPQPSPYQTANLRRKARLHRLADHSGGKRVPDPQVHDLRHTGNTLTAMTAGVSLKEPMSRMGRSGAKAAMIYLHEVKNRDRVIATAATVRSRPMSPKTS